MLANILLASSVQYIVYGCAGAIKTDFLLFPDRIPRQQPLYLWAQSIAMQAHDEAID